MPTMIFESPDGGTRKEVTAEAGTSVLDVAHTNGIEIEGACEGSMACSTCHVVVDEEGTLIAGRNPNINTGPNLYGIVGRTVGSVEDFRYSESLMEVGAEDGLGQAWNEEHFVGYVQDSQFDIDRWLLALWERDLDVAIYELPTIPGLVPRMSSGSLSGSTGAGFSCTLGTRSLIT